MLTLIETLTGFAAIMLMLSLLVKTLTSVLKNYLDYYSDNLEHEVKRLVLETTGKTWDEILSNPNTPAPVKSFANSIAWERLGAEFLSAGYLSWFLRQLDQNARVSDLESRLKIHVAKVNYAFEMRMKNLALAVGLGMCLLCNINAFTIWKTLYTDQQLRGTFANEYAKKATEFADAQAKAPVPPKSMSTGTPANPQNQTTPPKPADPTDKNQADEQMKDFQQNMKGFLTDVSFGVGRIWRDECLRQADSLTQACKENMGQQSTADAGKTDGAATQGSEAKPAEDQSSSKGKADTGQVKTDAGQPKADAQQTSVKSTQEPKETQTVAGIFVYEFFGSLLTGILISIGAPYWHDILQALSSLRAKPAAPAKAKA